MTDTSSRYEKFRMFHLFNPQVFKLFEYFARQAKDGVGQRKYYGARMIGERIRWHTSVETTDPEYKICNNHWPYYSRLLMLKYVEDFAGFFQRKDKNFDIDDVTLLAECG